MVPDAVGYVGDGGRVANKDKSVVVISSAEELGKFLGQPSKREPQNEEGNAERTSTTEHEVTIAGIRVPYTATCGTLKVQVDDPEQPKATIFFTAYTRSDVEQLASRPITFCFNGGPGSSSIWLHLGCFGPRRVRVDAGAVPEPPARAEDHPHSLLDVSDLVFIDPVGTGFSTADEGQGEPYHTVEGDVQSVGDFIRRYVTTAGRWESPKYVAGESYGTTRAAALAAYLQDRHGLHVNGLILLSTALQFQALKFDEGNDLPYALYLPGYAMTAAFHGRVEVSDLDAWRQEVEAFAIDRYTPALMRGNRLTEDETVAIAKAIAAYCGLSVEFVLRCNLRISLFRFCRELLRDRRQTVGRLDSRFVGWEQDAAGDAITHDPSLSALTGAFTSAFHRDLRLRLKYENDEIYELLSMKANRAWKFESDNAYLEVASRLRTAMRDNPHLRVFVASGWYDLATPYFGTEYTLAHLDVPPDVARSMTHRVYPAGHMMYVHEPSMEALRADLVAFYRAD